MEMDRSNARSLLRKPILALGELLVDLVPERTGMRIEDAGAVIKTASGSAVFLRARLRCWEPKAALLERWAGTA